MATASSSDTSWNKKYKHVYKSFSLLYSPFIQSFHEYAQAKERTQIQKPREFIDYLTLKAPTELPRYREELAKKNAIVVGHLSGLSRDVELCRELTNRFDDLINDNSMEVLKDMYDKLQDSLNEAFPERKPAATHTWFPPKEASKAVLQMVSELLGNPDPRDGGYSLDQVFRGFLEVNEDFIVQRKIIEGHALEIANKDKSIKLQADLRLQDATAHAEQQHMWADEQRVLNDQLNDVKGRLKAETDENEGLIKQVQDLKDELEQIKQNRFGMEGSQTTAEEHILQLKEELRICKDKEEEQRQSLTQMRHEREILLEQSSQSLMERNQAREQNDKSGDELQTQVKELELRVFELNESIMQANEETARSNVTYARNINGLRASLTAFFEHDFGKVITAINSENLEQLNKCLYIRNLEHWVEQYSLPIAMDPCEKLGQCDHKIKFAHVVLTGTGGSITDPELEPTRLPLVQLLWHCINVTPDWYGDEVSLFGHLRWLEERVVGPMLTRPNEVYFSDRPIHSIALPLLMHHFRDIINAGKHYEYIFSYAATIFASLVVSYPIPPATIIDALQPLEERIMDKHGRLFRASIIRIFYAASQRVPGFSAFEGWADTFTDRRLRVAAEALDPSICTLSMPELLAELFNEGFDSNDWQFSITDHPMYPNIVVVRDAGREYVFLHDIGKNYGFGMALRSETLFSVTQVEKERYEVVYRWADDGRITFSDLSPDSALVRYVKEHGYQDTVRDLEWEDTTRQIPSASNIFGSLEDWI